MFSLLATKLMSGLVEVAVAVNVQQQTTQRRYDIEISKMPSERASDKVEQLKATLSEVRHEDSDTDIAQKFSRFDKICVHIGDLKKSSDLKCTSWKKKMQMANAFEITYLFIYF